MTIDMFDVAAVPMPEGKVCVLCGARFKSGVPPQHQATLKCRATTNRYDAINRGLAPLDAGRAKLLDRCGIPRETLLTDLAMEMVPAGPGLERKNGYALAARIWAPRGAVALSAACVGSELAPIEFRERWLADYAADESMRARLDALPLLDLVRLVAELMTDTLGEEGAVEYVAERKAQRKRRFETSMIAYRTGTR